MKFAREAAEVLFIPGHTRGHIAYYFAQSGELFCGDTLFSGDCGRLRESTPAQMLATLAQLRAMPGSTRNGCSRVYTLNNLRFALTVEVDNSDLQERFAQVQQMRKRQVATIPSTMATERATNPFLRWESPTLRTATHSANDVDVFARLRALKDRF